MIYLAVIMVVLGLIFLVWGQRSGNKDAVKMGVLIIVMAVAVGFIGFLFTSAGNLASS
jgi:hypothetical protein